MTCIVQTYTCAGVRTTGSLLCGKQLGLGCGGLLRDLVEQLLEHLFWIMELCLDFLEHGEVLDDLLGKSIDSACEVRERGEETRRAAGGFGRLF